MLCGTHLEAGTIVGMNAAVIHHDKSIFGEDAASFRPERWIESDEEKIKLMDRHLMTVSAALLSLYRNCSDSNTSSAMVLERVLGKTSLLWKWESLFHF
jgi:hypothetical protein